MLLECAAHALDERGEVVASVELAHERDNARDRGVDGVDLVRLGVRDAHVEAESALGMCRVDLREDESQPVLVDLVKVEPEPVAAEQEGGGSRVRAR